MIPTHSGWWARHEGKLVHVFTVKGMIIFTGIALLGGLGLGRAIWGTQEPQGVTETYGQAQVSPSPYVVPTGTPGASKGPQEDSPGWDCRVQGNHVCAFDGELWLNVSHLPASLYARCLLGLEATGLSPEVASIDAKRLCEPLYVNG